MFVIFSKQPTSGGSVSSSQLAQAPSRDELFGAIDDIKQQYQQTQAVSNIYIHFQNQNINKFRDVFPVFLRRNTRRLRSWTELECNKVSKRSWPLVEVGQPDKVRAKTMQMTSLRDLKLLQRKQHSSHSRTHNYFITFKDLRVTWICRENRWLQEIEIYCRQSETDNIILSRLI